MKSAHIEFLKRLEFILEIQFINFGCSPLCICVMYDGK